MNYKLIAMDMDGTLLDSHKDILPSSYKAMKKADEQGEEVRMQRDLLPRQGF